MSPSVVDTTSLQAGPLLAGLVERARPVCRPERTGRVMGAVGLDLTIGGVSAAVGELLRVDTSAGPLMAEVVALSGDSLRCMPLGAMHGVRLGDDASATGRPMTVPAGWGLLGRVLDGLGHPIDGRGELHQVDWVSVDGTPPHPLRRGRVNRPLSLGVRALDTLIPVGAGQRMGIFAGSGVGKSTLLSMITRGTAAPIRVVALVGERGREVREFLEDDLGPEGMARSVVVIATSDQPPLVRLKAAFTATRIAEWFRDQGQDVLLLMDSLTRVAAAQREVGLTAGEPPATRGYPPSVFALLPTLLERAGAAEHGSITGLYTVLVEADDMNEPIGDAARSILDGHIVLSRDLATAGHFPSIDVLESISRVDRAITTPDQRDAAVATRSLLAALRDAKDLIEVGAYVPGTNPMVDAARVVEPAIIDFLRQPAEQIVPAAVAWQQLMAALAPILANAVPDAVAQAAGNAGNGFGGAR